MKEEASQKKTKYALYSTWDNYSAEKTFYLAKLVTIDGRLVLAESDLSVAYGDAAWAKRTAKHYGLSAGNNMPSEGLETASKAPEGQKKDK